VKTNKRQEDKKAAPQQFLFEQRSKFSQCNIFVVVMTTRVLQ